MPIPRGRPLIDEILNRLQQNYLQSLRAKKQAGATGAPTRASVEPRAETPYAWHCMSAVAGTPSLVIGDLEVLSEIGRGAHSVVYRARKEGRDFALKVRTD